VAVAFRANPPADGEPRELVVEADGDRAATRASPAGGSVVIDPVTGEVLAELASTSESRPTTWRSNNGMMAGVRRALEIDPQAVLHVRLDSKLVVEQMSGRWKIKNGALADLAAEARSILSGTPVSFEWIPRAENSRADRLANESMDKQASFSR